MQWTTFSGKYLHFKLSLRTSIIYAGTLSTPFTLSDFSRMTGKTID